MHHNFMRSCCALSASAALLASLAAPGVAFASQEFTDVNSEGWYAGEIAWVADEGIMGGYGDGSFGVGKSLTRAEFAQLLASWAEASEKGELQDTTGLPDLTEGGQWYTGAANWAVEDRVIMGVDHPDGSVTFDPDVPATREMVVTILWRMASQLGVDTSNDGAALAAMPDSDEVSEWAREAMAWAVDRGIITGVVRDDGSWIEPGRTVLREEIAKIVHVADEVTGGVFEGFAADDLVPAKAAISGAVSLSGRDLVAEEFSFELRDTEGNVVATAKNDAEGAFEFSVDVDRTGVFQYTIVSVSGDLDGVTYDEKEWSVQVVSSSEDGVLSATVTYPDGEPTFEMVYAGSPDVPEPSPDPDPDPDPDPGVDPDPDPDAPVTEDGITFEVVEEGDEGAEYGAGAYVTTVESENGAVVVPAELGGVPVVSISLTNESSVTSIDVSASGDTLKNLEVTGGELAELNLAGCTALEQLNCSENVLVQLDVSDCTSLDIIDCSNNYLQSIALPRIADTASVSLLTQSEVELKELDCSHNQISALDLSGIDSLVKVDCSYNRIEDLSGIQEWASVEGHEAVYEPQFWDSSDKTGLSYELHYVDAGYIEAHVTGCSLPDGGGDVVVPGTIEGCPVVLVAIDAWDDDGEALVDVSACERLRELNVYSHSDIRLDASGCAELVSVGLSGGYAARIDLAGCASLAELYLDGPIDSIDLSGAPALERLSLLSTRLSAPQLAEALEDTPALEYLRYSGTGGDLVLPGLPALTSLECPASSITSLDLSGCPALVSLDCSGNLIESLGLSGLPALERLDCWDNLIESLDVSACPSLWQLGCQGNRIADLTALREWLAQDGHFGSIEPQLAGEGEIEI